jgi:ribose transport system ATP-binding protein
MENLPVNQPMLQMSDISKSFFGVKVLDQVSIDLYPGEVMALIGENGAGKSTLIKILNGDYQKDGGFIVMGGKPVEIDRPRDAEELGIRMIYQELHHCHELSVTENLLLGHLPRQNGRIGKYLVDWSKAYQTARDHLGLLDIKIDPRARMGNLSVVEREIVEIVKAVSTNAKIIVMDEPTAALTPHEVDLLFQIVDALRQQGVGIIYISHRLDEIFRIAQRVTVLRDGQKVATHEVAEVTQRDLVRMMVGHEVEETRHAAVEGIGQLQVGQAVFEVSALTRAGAYEDVNFKINAGEIVGIFGLLGAGHYNLTRALFGAEKSDSGSIRVDGRPVSINSPTDARKVGIGLVPIDRKVRGLVLGRNVRENLTLSNWWAITRFGFFQRNKEKQHAQTWIDNLGIRVAGGMEVESRFMSGGNQQKVVLGRWLEAQVKVLLMNEPTWGVDIGARSDIYDQLESLAGQGLAIMMVSSDMQEVLSVSHRILTMYNGRITGEFSASEATQEKLLHAAAGGES